jgi:phosphoribosylformylglycinamidine synthase
VLLRRGGSALAADRRERLAASLAALDARVRGVAADEVFAVQWTAGATAGDIARLDGLLGSGDLDDDARAYVCVVPRPGTVSPWSSKATDIARVCGLDGVVRIERGVRWRIDGVPARAVGRPLPAAAEALLHDRMTEALLAPGELPHLFATQPPRPLLRLPLAAQGRACLERANTALGLALSDDEIGYLASAYARLGRDPTDVELMMFAQANSEHCRHKIFNARWRIDGAEAPHSLFAMIRNTHAAVNGRGILSAYRDNAAVMAGAGAERLHVIDGRYRFVAEPAHWLCKVETHNHPTAIAPFAGAATGSGGEIRDEGAVGRGSKPKAGLVGFATSHLEIPGDAQPWELGYGVPARQATPLQIMLDGPLGAARFNNEFGRPALAGFFRTLSLRVGGERRVRGYHKPVMVAGGIGHVRDAHVQPAAIPPGTPLVVLGGPAMLIGLGGGAASSLSSGTGDAGLDYASVQRDNAEMERRCQEVIDACAAAGDDNPILRIHDVGAGGLSNALPELVHGAGVGGRFDLRAVPSADAALSPLEIWCNEAQERYVLAIAAERLTGFAAVCARERCPYAVVGHATEAAQLVVDDARSGTAVVDLPLSVLLGRPPRLTRAFARQPVRGTPLARALALDVDAALDRVLRFPAVAAKGFLVTIGDRSITGLVARDQMVGPWQVPVADVAVTASGHTTFAGEAMAIGERSPLALIDSAAAARMAVAEALTNLLAAGVGELGDVRLSANWMAAAGVPGEDQALFDAVAAVGLTFCPALGIAIPVGKDSLSMRTTWRVDAAGERLAVAGTARDDASPAGTRADDGERDVTAPVTLVVSAFAPVADVRATLTPVLQPAAAARLLFVDLADGRFRLGGSVLAQVAGELGEACPDVTPAALLGLAAALRETRPGMLAYHDRSDGGLAVTLLEMCFAGRCGLDVDVGALADAGVGDLALLFAEEAGVVVQVDAAAVAGTIAAFAARGLRAVDIGRAVAGDAVRIGRDGRPLLAGDRARLQHRWQETSARMAALRDDAGCVAEEWENALHADPGMRAHVTFDAADDVAAPYVARGARPRVAVLREQGVNGHQEMAAAFTLAGFDAIDVHMSDIIDRGRPLSDVHVLVACGGFSYGDVLGAGAGWAASILHNGRARAAFAAFFARPDTLTLGVCNGCQALSRLRELIPGAGAWPRFERNRSAQFEARSVLVAVAAGVRSPWYDGMQGSVLPVPVAHGEGRCDAQAVPERLVALRYVDHAHAPTERYPFNPNGSPGGATGFVSDDGRATIVMPHPERVFRTVANSWHPPQWGDCGPWMRLFRNARRALG